MRDTAPIRLRISGPFQSEALTYLARRRARGRRSLERLATAIARRLIRWAIATLFLSTLEMPRGGSLGANSLERQKS